MASLTLGPRERLNDTRPGSESRPPPDFLLDTLSPAPPSRGGPDTATSPAPRRFGRPSRYAASPAGPRWPASASGPGGDAFQPKPGERQVQLGQPGQVRRLGQCPCHAVAVPVD